MRHQHKTLLFKCLTILPSSLGNYIYGKLQYYANRNSILNKIKLSRITFDKTVKICQDLNYDLSSKTLLEIGSGWYPILPYYFVFFGKIKTVYTYDINEHYNKNSIKKFNSIFSELNNSKFSFTKNRYNLPENIIYFPNTDIITSEIPNADVIFSRYVLSHMNEKDIVDFHHKLKNSLPKGTIIIHFISPSDLRQHNDRSISLQDFLQYSKKQWDNIQTRFDYHNRLRLPQFIQIFNQVGIEIVHLDYKFDAIGSENQKLFSKVTLHQDFQNFSNEELTASNIIVVLKL